MGNQTNKVNYTMSQLYQSNHPILKCCYTIDKTQPLQLLLTLSSINKDSFKIWQQKITNYHKLVPALEQQVQILYLPLLVKYEQEYLCGTTGVIKARYLASPLLLNEELNNRITIMKPFQQEQLMYLAYIMLYAAQKLHQNNEIIGDVRPRNIFLFQDGNIQLSCLASFQDQISAYQKAMKYKQQTFLAPEQIIDLQTNKQFTVNKQRSQDFSIGMTLMGLMLLHDQQLLYGSEKNLFDTQKFKKQLQFIANCTTYSQLLRKIVIGLLQWNLQDRLTSDQIISFLQVYKEEILSLNKIKIDQKFIQGTLLQKLNKINLESFPKSQINIYKTNLTFSFGQKTSPFKNRSSIIDALNQQDKKSSLIIHDNLNSHQILTPTQQKKFTMHSKIQENAQINNNKQQKQFKTEYKQEDNYSRQHSLTQPNYKNKSTRSMHNETNAQLKQLNLKQIYSNRQGKLQIPLSYDLTVHQSKIQSDFNKQNFNKNQNLNMYYAEAQTSSACQKYQQGNFARRKQSSPYEKLSKLQDKCIQTSSIKDYSSKKSTKSKAYQDVFKNIDEQLKVSRKMFPNS